MTTLCIILTSFIDSSTVQNKMAADLPNSAV